ncbi:Glutathione S-transferase 3 [Sphaceloma murrayae]|uniref:glutathione transferase n=1 Tax=Sphaceloma murrayae TaxID=2082308 RepID=A0A2K1QI88_9PEZI|nr:Glutathione S-transferase 3 [Sphaceloma murrayae]
MVLKLYGSGFAFGRVLLVILELGLPYEHILVDITKLEQKSPEHLKLQPFGKVPVLDDDGFVIFESKAICRYLVGKYGSKSALLPRDDAKAHARFEQACSVEYSYFAPASDGLGIELVVKQLFSLGAPDQALVAKYEADLESVLVYYDELLSTQSYLAGDELTLVDLFHLPNAGGLKDIGYGEMFKKYPHVDAWLSKLQDRETWKEASLIAGVRRT